MVFFSRVAQRLATIWLLIFGGHQPDYDTLKPMSDRMLGIGVTEGSIGFEAAFTTAKQSGIQFLEFAQQWDDIETSQGSFNSEFLSLADEYYPPRNVSLVLSLNPIDTNNLRVPGFYSDLSWSERVDACIAWIDWTLAGLPNTDVLAIAVGNEVDAWLSNQDESISLEYAAFFDAIRSHIRTSRPDLPVGVKMTLEGYIPTVDANADVHMITYYPFEEGLDFQVKPIGLVAADIATIMNATTKPVYVLEAGMPTVHHCGSSVDKQAAFVDEMFSIWDQYLERMPLVLFNWLVDVPRAQVNQFMRYYGIRRNKGFRCFLSSLGMMKSNGKVKPALGRLRDNVNQRNG